MKHQVATQSAKVVAKAARLVLKTCFEASIKTTYTDATSAKKTKYRTKIVVRARLSAANEALFFKMMADHGVTVSWWNQPCFKNPLFKYNCGYVFYTNQR